MVEAYQVKETEEQHSLLNTINEYYASSTDAPSQFGQMLGIQLIGHAMGYDPVHLIQPKPLHHNLFTCLVGESTITRKSTSQSLAKEIYPIERSLPEESSPEKLVENLSEQPEAVQWGGEFSGLLKGINNGGYMTRFAELYNDLYDCPARYRRSLMSGDYEIDNCYLSLSSTVTPGVLKKYVSEEMATGGFLPRWMFVHGQGDPQPRRWLQPSVLRFKDWVSFIVERMIEIDMTEMSFVFDEDALNLYNSIEQRELKKNQPLPFVGRYLDNVIKTADILAVSDLIGYEHYEGSLPEIQTIKQLQQLIHLEHLEQLGGGLTDWGEGGTPNNCCNRFNCLIVLPPDYVRKAWEIVEPSLRYATSLVQHVKLDRPMSKLADYIQNHSPTGHSTTMRNTGLRADVMEKAISSLVQMKCVKPEHKEIERENRGTIKKTIYHWVD